MLFFVYGLFFFLALLRLLGRHVAAGEKALRTLIPSLVANWERPHGGRCGLAEPATIEIVAGGMDQLWKLKETRVRLKGMDGIEEVVQKSYAQGVAIFRVESRLPAEELAEALVLEPPEDLMVQVVEIKPNVLDIRVVESEDDYE